MVRIIDPSEHPLYVALARRGSEASAVALIPEIANLIGVPADSESDAYRAVILYLSNPIKLELFGFEWVRISERDSKEYLVTRKAHATCILGALQRAANTKSSLGDFLSVPIEPATKEEADKTVIQSFRATDRSSKKQLKDIDDQLSFGEISEATHKALRKQILDRHTKTPR